MSIRFGTFKSQRKPESSVQMTNRTNVPGLEDKGTGHRTGDSPRNRGLIYSGLLDIKKSKSKFKFFLVFLVFSYLLGFCWIGWIYPIFKLYGRSEEMVYRDVSLRTRIALPNQKPSKIQKEAFQSRLNPQHSGVRCSSLIDVVFSTGGYTGNVYHEFNDGLLPLYITSQHLQGEVVFIILEYHEWWMMKYQDIVKQLSKYPVLDFRGDKKVHCFPEMIVGMKIHDELTVNSSLMKDGKTIRDFQSLLAKAYAPPKLNPMAEFTNLTNETSTVPLYGLNSTSASMNISNVLMPSSLKPKLVIISRPKSRVMLNQNEIVLLAEKIGFQVEILNPKPTTEMVEMFRILNSCDVMLGVHGAAMTHFLLMRSGSVLIQIVPLGTDWAAATYYGEPAMKLGLKYIEYKIVPEESSLYESYERDDPVLTDPDSINRQGWWETKKVYLDGQNVRPSLKLLKKRLVSAFTYSLSTAHARTEMGNCKNRNGKFAKN